MISWSRTRTIVTGIALIIVCNAVVLLGVAHNRSGEPESKLRLTERELQPLYGRASQEMEGVRLNLQWRVLPRNPAQASMGFNGGDPAWLDEAKLASLGFDMSPRRDTPEGRRYYEKLLPREILLVLELNGGAYQEALKRAQHSADAESERSMAGPVASATPRRNFALEQLEREQTEVSRLFAVDAGLDAGTLRSQYPDRARYAIVRGQAHVYVDRYGGDPATPSGFVRHIGNSVVSAPKEFRDLFDSLATNTSRKAAPVDIEVAFGRRLEPWIVLVSRGEEGQQK